MISTPKIDDLTQSFFDLKFPRRFYDEFPSRENVLKAREKLSDLIAYEDFLLECLSLELRRFDKPLIRRGLNPFFEIPELGIRMALGYWSPKRAMPAHEHSWWTMTVVLINELEVRTFDYEKSVRSKSLVQKNCFRALPGKVGYIYDPCIHQPRNVSNRWSLSLHVFSKADGKNASGIFKMDPSAMRPLTDRRPILTRQIAQFASTVQNESSEKILRQCETFPWSH